MKKIVIIISLLTLMPINVFAFNDTSESSIVIDIDSGRILYENNCDQKKLIASTTKIMTAVVAIENGDLTKKVVVGNEILKMYGTNIYLEVNEKITLEDLIYGLLLRSGNDAAVVISNHICNNEKEFVKLMNKKAELLGMTNTHFENPHGLDEENRNYSTARDMAILSSYASKIKEYGDIIKTKKYITKTDKKSYIWYNRNKFLNIYKYATGGKNGYTPKAGKTLVTTANKNNFSITTVSLKDQNPFDNHKNIDEYVYSRYTKELIIDKNNFSIPNYFSKSKVYIKQNFYYPLTEKEKNDILTIISLNKKKKDYIVGDISVYLKNKKIFSENIYEKNNQNKIIDRIKKFISKI